MFDWTWGTFGATHIASLVFAVLINIVLYLVLRKQTRKIQILVLFILSFSGISAIIYNLLAWNSPFEYLPLHLCSLNAMLLPFAVLTRKKWCCNLLLLWSLGSYVALILNMSMTNAQLFSWPFFFYYFPHVLEAGIPIILFALKLVERDPKTIKSTLAITFTVYTIIHFINVAINSAGIIGPNGDVIQVNYMFSITPTNPLLNLFWMIIPHSYWYMFLAIPVIIIYLGWWYLPELLDLNKKKQLQKKRAQSPNGHFEEEEEYVGDILKFD